MTNKLTLFRLHNQKDDSFAKEIVEFTKDYMSLSERKSNVFFTEFTGLPGFENTDPEKRMFDIMIQSNDDIEIGMAHASAWTYCRCKGDNNDSN
jgi:hypothetical protein